MKKSFTVPRSLLSLGCALAIGVSTGVAQADDYDLPRLLVIGTPGTSSGSFASTNGWAPVLKDQVGTNSRIVPEDSETQRYKRLTERRDINMSSVSSAEMRFQIEGIGAYAGMKPVPQRMVWHHNDTPWGFVVSGDSDIETMDDLKKGGVRVAQGAFSPPMTTAVQQALPAYLGMTEEEASEKLEFVPASSYVENCRSVVEGKADVAYCATISSVLSEMEGAPGGIRWLNMDIDDKEAWAGYLKHRPMVVPTTMTLGVSTARGVDGLASNFVYAVPADVDDAFAYSLAKWFHQSFDDYKGSHGLATRMDVEIFREYLDRAPIPVHEGTVRYLKEIDMWTEEDDAWNNEAIDKMDAWIEARKAALAEARDEGVEISHNNDEFMTIYRKHTDGLEGFRSRL
ncbi:TAXI family TRAP transporter solute-binding subunit [Marinobacter bryozoorum]|uniref:TAXI family TRAP transporter solute-binding subunit n=1 Tax=Marinobacter bryozoorum TaxID=256324 RepID=UPI002003F7C2|nr:TAXI family TRAP transporter solute-binding subunit [Marinobacter bryozoorum]MCK7545140.1 TAXI family TRAP transporter solute-binding subunit [Marinobacter bryozoorum]